MKIEYKLDNEILQEQGARVYTVKVDGETILECLGEDELDDLTIGEIKRIVEEGLDLEGAKASESLHREVRGLDWARLGVLS